MKAIAYSIQNHEKVSLAKANSKRHDFLFISNDLNEANLTFAVGKEVLILFKLEPLTLDLLKKIKAIGIELIISRDSKPSSDLLQLATQAGVPITHLQCSWSDEKKAHQIINILDYASNRSQEIGTIHPPNNSRHNSDKRIDKQI